ncbi:MAG TPA: SRPBCC domain-containing protein [Bryobacteraceae bacterium]|nr:SRPBCC domain-containing protein [Bryobacteraceae bacterium]
MPDILHRVGIAASPDKVFAALTEQSGLSGWWTTNVKASPKVGAVNEFRFDAAGFNDMKVEELVPGKRVRWQCVNGAPEWIGTEVVFDLRQEKGATILLFAQRNWRQPVEFMHYCSTKWATYLLSLKSLCESGKGTPYPDDIDIG